MKDIYVETLAELEEIKNKFDRNILPSMGEERWEVLFAKIYQLLNHYYASTPASLFVSEGGRTDGRLLSAACLLMENLGSYLNEHRVPVKEQTIKLYELIVERLVNLVWKEFSIKQSAYDDAVHLHKMDRARKACGIWDSGKGNVGHRYTFEDPEALAYASEHLVAFSKWVHLAGTEGRFSPDPLKEGPDATGYGLFERAAALQRASIRIAQR